MIINNLKKTVKKLQKKPCLIEKKLYLCTRKHETIIDILPP